MHVQLASLNVANLFTAMPAGIAQGIIWGIMALGVFITFRLLDIADLTVDGSFTTGGAVTVMMILAGKNPWVALLCAMLAGFLAGALTGALHTKFGIPAILAGILTQFSLYSINLAIMGMSANKAVSVDRFPLVVTSRNITGTIVIGAIATLVLVGLLYWFFGTEVGSAMRATGCNPTMAKAQCINIDVMKVLGLAMSNAIVALSGGLMAQFQGFADINMGRGSIVIGLAAVIIGEVIGNAIMGKHLNFAGKMGFIALGGVVYYIVIVIVLWMKLNSNYLKLLTAAIVTIFLAVPNLQAYSRNSFKKAARNSKKMEDL